MGTHWAQLKVSKQTYAQRTNRLRDLIEDQAPPIAVWLSARYVLDSMHYPMRIRWHRWSVRNLPGWVLWLISPIHRVVMRELRSYEQKPELAARPRIDREALTLLGIALAVEGFAVAAIWLYGHYRMGW